MGVHRTVSSSGIRFTLSDLHFFSSCGRNSRFHGGTDRSACAITVTDGQFWTDPWQHLIDRSSTGKNTLSKPYSWAGDGFVVPQCKISRGLDIKFPTWKAGYPANPDRQPDIRPESGTNQGEMSRRQVAQGRSDTTAFDSFFFYKNVLYIFIFSITGFGSW